MKPEQQEREIALEVGWKYHRARLSVYGLNWESPHGTYFTDPPPYTRCLNEMRCALLTLDDEQAIRYRCVLTQMAVDRNFDPMMATARQQAEAFLRTLNLYTE